MPAYSHLMKPRDYGTPQQVFAVATYEAGGPERLAHKLGKSRQMVNLKSDPDAPNRVLWSDVCTAVDMGAREPVHQICARAGGVFMPVETARASLPELAKRTPVEFGEFMCRLINVLTKDNAGFADKAMAVKELDDTVRVLMAVRAHFVAD